ncbi:defect at low temperature protein 1 [Zygosaccharomyces mellis]|uniref:Defect at low temperature protein 1 n=1 Tax=Zygosaccharomyces mellis TaxID=42258 RepID=A0A4C2E7B6_9SACH|nr:defect at low temperature protein 1 [Zygosaccharomyces mellis]
MTDTDLEIWKIWIFRGIIGVALTFLVGFSIVLPVDCIVQAAESSNNALNTFIVVGALVAYGLVSIIIIVGRIIFCKSCIQDIPRQYLPITPNDLPHRGSRKMIMENMEKSKELSILFKKPKEPVIHPGLEPPSHCDDPHYEKLFPEYLNYRACIKSLSDRLKYQGIFLNNMNIDMKLGETFADVVRNQFIKNTRNKTQLDNSKKFIYLYETIRYSGQEVTRQQFIEFVSLALYFVEVSLTRDDRSLALGDLSSRSQLQFNFDNGTWENDASNYSFMNDAYSYGGDSYYPENINYLKRTNSTSTVARKVPSIVLTNLEEENKVVLDPPEPVSHKPSI